jgi:hypothetical protein
MKYKFNSGAEFDGTFEQLLQVADALHEKIETTKLPSIPPGYYNSKSLGLIKISEMKDPHIRRALAKIARTYYENLYISSDTNKQFLSKFVNMPDCESVSELYAELERRS